MSYPVGGTTFMVDTSENLAEGVMAESPSSFRRNGNALFLHNNSLICLGSFAMLFYIYGTHG